MQRGREALVRAHAARRGKHLAAPHLVTADAAQQPAAPGATIGHSPALSVHRMTGGAPSLPA
jgi:hypothetical protein